MSLPLVILGQIAPIFLVMAAGFAVSSAKWIDRDFVTTANRLNFRIGLPTLVFLSVSRSDFSHGIPLLETGVYLAALLIATAAGYALSALLRLPTLRRASMVQGSIRGNLAIVGLAVFQQVLGPQSLATASLYLAFFMLVHNLIGMSVLSSAAARSGARAEDADAANSAPRAIAATDDARRAAAPDATAPAEDAASGTEPLGSAAYATPPADTGSTSAKAGFRSRREMARQMGMGVLTSFINPLMIGVYLGIAVAIAKVTLPKFVTDTLGYLGQLALPLALLGIGGALREYSRPQHLAAGFAASAIKLLFMPAVAIIAGLLLHLPKEPLLMVAVFSGSPAAVATYALADGMGADRDTAGSIVMLSHLLCILTLTAVIVAVRLIAP